MAYYIPNFLHFLIFVLMFLLVELSSSVCMLLNMGMFLVSVATTTFCFSPVFKYILSGLNENISNLTFKQSIKHSNPLAVK